MCIMSGLWLFNGQNAAALCESCRWVYRDAPFIYTLFMNCDGQREQMKVQGQRTFTYCVAY